MNFLEFAKSEIEKAGLFSEEGDFYGGMTGKALMELCEVFSRQNHSGMSAGIVASLFKQLTEWQPLSPLTGDEDEWMEVGTDIYQNKRCPSVFKEGEGGQAYQIDYFVFIDKDGVSYTSKNSRKYIESFPYVPQTVYVHEDKDKQEQEREVTP